MIIADGDAGDLKTWVVKRLEDLSDADSDVLADYVLALIRADTPEPDLRISLVENLEDFLKTNTKAFVDEIFTAIKTKSYMPGYVAPSNAPSISLPFSAPSGPGASYGTLGASQGTQVGLQESRKRSHNDRNDDGNGNGNGIDLHYVRDDRQIKQMRRGRGGRGDGFGARGGRGGFQEPGYPHAGSPPVPAGFPPMPIQSQGMPFDPNDPMAAFMAMQAMGLPALPGMPPLPQAGSPNGQIQLGGLYFPDESRRTGTVRERCKDYDTQGYCTRGDTCPYLHGTDRLVVPGEDEYDPKNSILMDVSPTSPASNGHSAASGQQGNGYRGSGRGRGRGGFTPKRTRAEFSQAGPNHDRSITTIVVEQIPEEKFDEKSVRGFFSEFGTVQEVIMQPYKRLALVKYDDYFAARSAYDSPKVIFDNRFVKVYWYNPDSVPTPPTISKPAVTSPTQDKQPFDKEKFERDAVAAQKKLEEKKVQMKDMEVKRQALEKQKEELAQKQAEEKQKLMEKLAAKGSSSEIDTAMTDTKTNSTNGAGDSKASAHTKALRAKVAELEAEAKSLGLDSALSDTTHSSRGRGRGRGRGSYRGWEGFAGRGAGYDASFRGNARGRGAFRGQAGGKYNLDNRTKKVAVFSEEFTSEKDEALRQHLLGVGEFEAIEPHPDRPDTQIISFKDRPTAESFMFGTKDIPSVGKLEFSWYNTPLPTVQVASKQVGADGDVGMGGTGAEGDNTDKGVAEVDYDVAEEDDRWIE